VLKSDLLRSKVLLDGDRKVRAPLHRRVVGNDQTLALLHAADAGDDARRRRFALIHFVGGEWRQLEKWSVRIEQGGDALADRHLTLLLVPRYVFLPAPLPRLSDPALQL